MKKLLIVAVLLFPGVSSAYDILTVPESEINLPETFGKYLEAERQRWCEDELDQIGAERREIKKTSKWSTKFRSLDVRRKNANEKCSEVMEKIEDQTVQVPEINKSLRCGLGHVKYGGACVSHTQNCEMQYGKNITGQKSSNPAVSQCTCNTGYKLSGKQCVQKMTSPAPVATTSATMTNAEMQALIVELMKQLQALLAMQR